MVGVLDLGEGGDVHVSRVEEFQAEGNIFMT
jgi:hypothetical protein